MTACRAVCMHMQYLAVWEYTSISSKLNAFQANLRLIKPQHTSLNISHKKYNVQVSFLLSVSRWDRLEQKALTDLTTSYDTRWSLQRKFYHLQTWRPWLCTAWSNTACNSCSHWLLYHTRDIPVGIDPSVTALLSLTILFHLQCCNIIAWW
jgi:hypothetical protein